MGSRNERRPAPGLCFAAMALTVILTGCRKGDVRFPDAPVILISIDTLRADHLPSYGYRNVATPALDDFRKDSVLFENAYSHVPLTFPSHATILTGLIPPLSGVRDNLGFRMPPGHPTLASLLRSRGYSTGAAVSAYVLRRELGIAAGFDSYDDDVDPGARKGRAGGATAASLERWISANSNRKLFAFLHLYEPHFPYRPAGALAQRYSSLPYDGEIASADSIVGNFVDFLKKSGLYDRSLILVLSDHGEGLGEHGEDQHGVFLYREDLRVPLLVKLPGGAFGGATSRSTAQLTDVLPTVIDLIGGPIPPGLSGVSLRGPLTGKPAPERDVYAESFYPELDLGWAHLRSLAGERYQFIEAVRPELYDMIADPAEKTDLASSRPPPLRRMSDELRRIPLGATDASGQSAEELRRLASLGYVHAVSAPPPDGSRPDPKDRIGALRDYQSVFAASFAGDDAETVRAARALLSREPRILSVWGLYARALSRLHKPLEARDALRGALRAAGPGGIREERAQIYRDLSAYCDQAGDGAGAREALREAARERLGEEFTGQLARRALEDGRPQEAAAMLEPLVQTSDPKVLALLGVALAETNRAEEAERTFERGLRIDPENDEILQDFGTLELSRNRPARAREYFERSLRSKPDSAQSLSLLGQALAAEGQGERAAQAWARAVAVDPRQADSLFNLAVYSMKSGQAGKAREWFERFVAVAPRGRYSKQLQLARQALAALPPAPRKEKSPAG